MFRRCCPFSRFDRVAHLTVAFFLNAVFAFHGTSRINEGFMSVHCVECFVMQSGHQEKMMYLPSQPFVASSPNGSYSRPPSFHKSRAEVVCSNACVMATEIEGHCVQQCVSPRVCGRFVSVG